MAREGTDFTNLSNVIRQKEGEITKMFLRTKLTVASMTLALLTTAGAAAQTQQSQSPTQNPTTGDKTQRRFGRDGERRQRDGRAPLGGLRELNLTDEQKQQVRSIMERNLDSTKAQRAELRTLGQKRFEGTLTPEEQARAKELHQQMAQSRQSAMNEVQGILTAEQKTKLEEFRQERGPKHGRRGQFGDRPRANDNLKPSQP